MRGKSDVVKVIPGAPHAIEAIASETNNIADGTDETTNGQATVTLCAPDEPGIQRVVAPAGGVETYVDILAEAADLQIGGVTALDLADLRIMRVPLKSHRPREPGHATMALLSAIVLSARCCGPPLSCWFEFKEIICARSTQ